MARIWILAALGVAVAVAGVAWYVHPPGKPRGYAGLEFSVMTPAAAARAPLLTSRGALIYDVAEASPADKAGLHAGEVVAAIDGAPVTSAQQASGIVRQHRDGDRVVFTIFDETVGDIHSKDVAVNFIAQPPVTKKRSVKPPRTLAKEYFPLPTMGANADWSRRIARGPTIRPLAIPGLGAGRCNGFAPEDWFVAAHASDDSMIHVMAPTGFEHAIYQSAKLDGRAPRDFVLGLIAGNFQGVPTSTPDAPQPFGFRQFDFGLSRGAVGFAEYRVSGDRIAVWIAAVAAADAAWAQPQTGAVVFSLHCPAAGAPAPLPRDRSLAPTSVSTSCLQGACGEGDFAAHYMSVLRLGYVHAPDGSNYLIKPKSDYWQNGAEGPGYYHQVGGANEKLEPGRTN
jgi:hypothetical protein